MISVKNKVEKIRSSTLKVLVSSSGLWSIVMVLTSLPLVRRERYTVAERRRDALRMEDSRRESLGSRQQRLPITDTL